MRTRIYTISLALALGMALAPGAQAKPHGTKSGSHITLTGCLQSGATLNTYVLNNVMSTTAESSRNQATSTPSEMARSESSSYVLVPEGKVNLQKFVGQRVRVTGTISGEQSTSNPSSSSAGNTKQPSSTSGKNELKVMAIHKISGTCP
jgi:hypothetical protein